ncbi:hypothetical protein ABFS82_10G055500 [Erythranthe guttata]
MIDLFNLLPKKSLKKLLYQFTEVEFPIAALHCTNHFLKCNDAAWYNKAVSLIESELVIGLLQQNLEQRVREIARGDHKSLSMFANVNRESSGGCSRRGGAAIPEQAFVVWSRLSRLHVDLLG